MEGAKGGGNAPDIKKLLSESVFEVGGVDQLTNARLKHESSSDAKALEADWAEILSSVQIRVGTLLKADSVSFLLGAGASKECGGVIMTKLPREIEYELCQRGITKEDGSVAPWLRCLYVGIARIADAKVPLSDEEIRARAHALEKEDAVEFPVNFEALLSLLYRWLAALPESGGKISLDGTPAVNADAKEIQDCIRHATNELAKRCVLPKGPAVADGVQAYSDLLRKLLTRPLNLRRANIFTLNYDTLVEQAADAEGIVLVDGFIGTLRRIFRPECYDQDLYFPAQTTEGRVHRLDKVLHLYKLHGSITWAGSTPDWDNPYGVVTHSSSVPEGEHRLIYPTPAKYGETLGMPYAELFRRFASLFIRPQSTLFVIGYGFGDDHVNAIIRQALTIPSLTLVIVSPSAKSAFVENLRKRNDRRVLIFSGTTLGTFSGFVRFALPDLRDEEVRQKVMATYRALAPAGAGGNGG